MSYSWYLQRNGEEDGPITSARIAEMARDGNLTPDEYIRRSDMNKWIPAGKVKGLHFSASSAVNPERDAEIEIVEELTTASGKVVVLLSNGTWRFKAVNVLIQQPEPKPDQVQLPGVAPQGFHFRKSRWGMSEREVRDSEPHEPTLTPSDALFYEGHIAGLPCQIIYVFVQNQLVRTKYLFSIEHSNENHFIGDFITVKDLLSEKYGLPVAKDGSHGDAIWMNDLYRDDPDDWGTAIAAGHLAYLAEWDLPDTKIGILLRGDNYEIQLTVEYYGKEYEGLEEETRQQQYLEDL